jgi:hypothetical protein
MKQEKLEDAAIRFAIRFACGFCKNDDEKTFIAGAKSDAAKNYWFEEFKKEIVMNKELEEAAEKFYPPTTTDLICSPKLVRDAFVAGAKWQEKIMYSEEEVYELLKNYQSNYSYANNEIGLKKWFEEFKKNF